MGELVLLARRPLGYAPVLGDQPQDIAQSGHRMGFLKIAVHTQTVRPRDVFWRSGTAEKDDRYRGAGRLASYPFENFQAVHQRHLQVEHHHIRKGIVTAVTETSFGSQVISHVLTIRDDEKFCEV